MTYTPDEVRSMVAQARELAELSRAHQAEALDQCEHDPEDELFGDLEENESGGGFARQEEPARHAFDPDQPRDDSGKWAGGSADSGDDDVPVPEHAKATHTIYERAGANDPKLTWEEITQHMADLDDLSKPQLRDVAKAVGVESAKSSSRKWLLDEIERAVKHRKGSHTRSYERLEEDVARFMREEEAAAALAEVANEVSRLAERVEQPPAPAPKVEVLETEFVYDEHGLLVGRKERKRLE